MAVCRSEASKAGSYSVNVNAATIVGYRGEIARHCVVLRVKALDGLKDKMAVHPQPNKLKSPQKPLDLNPNIRTFDENNRPVSH